MRFEIMTLFPDMMETIFGESILGRAIQRGLIEINCRNIRDYSADKHRRVDDTPYGGGMGMLMSAPPIYSCHSEIKKTCKNPHTVYMSPKGRVLTQDIAKSLMAYDEIIILCGHYEGVDQRVIDAVVDEEISVGDYVLTGGELPAAILVDCLSRMVDGVLSDSECYEKESIASGLLEYPQYTRPFDFMGNTVPEVLISGHHENIDLWRFEEALKLTLERRPDLLEGAVFEGKYKKIYDRLKEK